MYEIGSSPLIIVALGALSVFLFAAGIMSALSGNGNVERLRERLHTGEQGVYPVQEKTGSLLTRGVARLFALLGEKLGPKDDERITQGQLALIQAGVRGPNAGLIFQGVKASLTLLLAGGALLVRLLFLPEMSMHMSIIAVAFPAAVGLYVPEIWLRMKTSARKEKASDELPDALDLLVVCVEAGMGLDQAIYRVSKELQFTAPIISSELRTLTLQLRAGKQRQEALRAMSERVGLDDLNSLCTLLIQADVFGISVAHTLRVYSDALRTKRFQRAEEKAAKLPVKIMIPLIIFILPALFIAIMGPAGIRLVDVLGNMK
ncbi:MAG: type II secretion system F family protein [Desulfovibrionaceae bacterium]